MQEQLVNLTAEKQISKTVKTGRLSLEDLFAYLKDSKSHHMALVDLVQKYENKVSLLHDEVAQTKTSHSELVELFGRVYSIIKTLDTFFTSQNSSSSSSYQRALSESIRKTLCEM